MSNEPKANPKKPQVIHSAHQRAQAVLSVWTERRRPCEICRELGITSMLLANWQERAMAGMLQALQPRSRPELQRSPALTAKLERLLSRQTLSTEGKLSKLDKRLRQLQSEPSAPAPTK
jgi:transposase-like protein